jgi:hypothetical protein
LKIRTETLRRLALLKRLRVVKPFVSISTLVAFPYLARLSGREAEGEEETCRVTLTQLKAPDPIPLDLTIVIADRPIVLSACGKEIFPYNDGPY